MSAGVEGVVRLIHDHLWGILTVWQEARGECYEGKKAVAEVILRRTQQKYSSDGTIAGTCLWPLQFSGWNAKDPNRIKAAQLDSEDALVLECEQAFDDALKGSNMSQGALLYLNPAGVTTLPAWAVPEKLVVTIGHHNFYTV